MNLIEENNELLNRIKSATGDTARLAHRLSETTNRLEHLINLIENKKSITPRILMTLKMGMIQSKMSIDK